MFSCKPKIVVVIKNMSLLAKCVLYPVTGAVLVAVAMSAALLFFDVGVLAVGAAFFSAAVCGLASYPLLTRARTPNSAGLVGIATVVGIYLLYPIPFSFLSAYSLLGGSASFLSELRNMYGIWVATTALFTGWFTLPIGFKLSVGIWREHVAS